MTETDLPSPDRLDNDRRTNEQHVETTPSTHSASASSAKDSALTALLDRAKFVENETAGVDLPSFTPSSYATFITGSGAEKLAESGVAPLVAKARGYGGIDGTNFAIEMREMSIKMSTTQGKRLQRSLNGPGQDGMRMPWFSLASIDEASSIESEPKPFTNQIRPGRPENNPAGKPIKYEFPSGVGTPLDVHPATSASWIDSTLLS